MPLFKVDKELCKRHGICAPECPAGIIAFTMKNICLLMALMLSLTACTTRLRPPSGTGGTRVEFAGISQSDSYGRPAFGAPLERRPAEAGSMYAMLRRDERGLITRSYLIAVTNGDGPDLSRPFRVFYKWTGKGFEVAGRMVKRVLIGEPRADAPYGDPYLVLFLTASTATVTVAGGVVVGMATGTWEAGREVTKALRKEEYLASFTDYEYDGMGRLVSYRSFVPGEHPVEIISSTYEYTRDSLSPVAAEVRSIPDGISHTLRFR